MMRGATTYVDLSPRKISRVQQMIVVHKKNTNAFFVLVQKDTAEHIRAPMNSADPEAIATVNTSPEKVEK